MEGRDVIITNTSNNGLQVISKWVLGVAGVLLTTYMIAAVTIWVSMARDMASIKSELNQLSSYIPLIRESDRGLIRSQGSIEAIQAALVRIDTRLAEIERKLEKP